MEKPKIMIINNPPSVVHISRNEPPLSPRPTLTSHNQKIVDGIPIKYVCTPCPECKAKLEAAEEMAKAIRQAQYDEALDHALSAWEKAEKGLVP